MTKAPMSDTLGNPEKSHSMTRPIVPVYLNQKLVFDLLAMLQDGISTVTTVVQTTTDGATDQQQVSAGFGLGAALSTLVRVGLSADMSSRNIAEESTTSSEARVYTPASLFFQLRNLLNDKGYISCNSQNLPQPGDFFEFEGALNRNPVIETLDSFYELGEFVTGFRDSSSNTHPRRRKPKQQQQGRRNTESDDDRVLREIRTVRESITKANTMDLVVRNVNGTMSAVITLEVGFLNDSRLSDLVDGRFRVLGKVINAIGDDSDSISLLRDTILNMVARSFFDNLSHISEQLRGQQGFDIPELQWKVKGPAIHILPIAIFA